MHAAVKIDPPAAGARRLPLLFSAMLCALLGSGEVAAKVSAEEAAHLGRKYTDVGAIRQGNEDGSIPQWAGKAIYLQYRAGVTHYFKNGAAELKKLLGKRPLPKGVEDADEITPELLETLRNFVVEEFERFRPQIASLGLPPIHPLSVATLDAYIEKAPAEYQPMIRELERLLAFIGREALDAQFVITKENYQQYAEKLTVGQRAMFERFPGFRMKVHPSIRSAYYPDEINKATIANATTAELFQGRYVTGANLGFPFPIPQSGEEVIWNHRLKFRGSALRRVINDALVQTDGNYQISKTAQDIEFYYASLSDQVDRKDRDKIFSIMMETLEPPDVAGQRLLAHENITEGRSRDVFLFTEGVGLREVPEAGYDTPLPMAFGELYADQADMFNGATDRYDWRLVGRKEFYIPYNNFELNSPMLQYRDILKPYAIARDVSRYELHRVWVVEATLKQGVNHQLKRRTFYVDEDSWSIAAVDAYDNQDKLWRYQEAYLIPIPFIPTVSGIPEAYYDLQSGRYFASGLTSEERIPDWHIEFRKRHFSPRTLKKPKLFR